MIYVRGARFDYDHWAYLGNTGWSWADVLTIFRRMEDYDGGTSALHGVDGPLRVLTRYQPDPVQRSAMDGFVGLGLPVNADYNSGLLDGVSSMALTIKDGRRHRTAAAYLRPVETHPNLTVLTGAHVRRLRWTAAGASGWNGSAPAGWKRRPPR
ncbi:GMC family oxidoreductase N-terminal domain-containing protein [Mycobacterium tilburgii]|uniref:GMC family oxidoreductase N-terminal domain-containing protein n=1 Tax=Mycobacterium tilburgii TaxID=44467 RepID=UPI002E131FFA